MKDDVYRLTVVNESTIHGKGLFARAEIEIDSWLGTYEGPEASRNGSHVLWVYEDDGLVGRSGRNKLRYLNHSTNPNAEFNGFDLFALRDISIGEEVTIHYGEDWEDIN